MLLCEIEKMRSASSSGSVSETSLSSSSSAAQLELRTARCEGRPARGRRRQFREQAGIFRARLAPALGDIKRLRARNLRLHRHAGKGFAQRELQRRNFLPLPSFASSFNGKR